METKINIDGFIYKTAPETGGCEGCAFKHDVGDTNCNITTEQSGIDCVRDEIIWIKEAVKTGVMSKQVGGTHYQKSIQPWDIIAEWKLGYWRGNIIKYVLRAPHKNGKEDLEKARHYLDYLIDNYELCETEKL